MKNLAVLARILFALPFGIIGLNHFLMTDIFLGMMSSFIPGGAFTILITGALLIATSISIILNKFINIACFGLAGLLFIFITTIHIPGLMDIDPRLASESMINLLKDTSLMGGAILIALFFESQPKSSSKKQK
jgi:uncharacterized membrane protein